MSLLNGPHVYNMHGRNKSGDIHLTDQFKLLHFFFITTTNTIPVPANIIYERYTPRGSSEAEYESTVPECTIIDILLWRLGTNSPTGFRTWADSTIRVASQRFNQFSQKVRPASERLAGRLGCRTFNIVQQFKDKPLKIFWLSIIPNTFNSPTRLLIGLSNGSSAIRRQAIKPLFKPMMIYHQPHHKRQSSMEHYWSYWLNGTQFCRRFYLREVDEWGAIVESGKWEFVVYPGISNVTKILIRISLTPCCATVCLMDPFWSI